ncbi:MAG: DUF192 domain-containing protein [Woeseiaceae bacterium]
MTRVVLLAAILLGPALDAAAQSYGLADLATAFEQDVVVIEASHHACHAFDVFLARSIEQQRRGLMHVRSLPETAGMLFVYADETLRSMWMRNTFIPLDMLFIRADGSVASIARDTEPLSLKSIASAEPVKFVLELNAGVTAALHIEAGSRMIPD